MNFTAEVVERLPPTARALVELARDGSRREWTFAQVGDSAARLAGALEARGIGRGDVVMTLIGNRPEWVLSMLACFRIGAVVLPCTEQLRAHDLRLRIEATRPSVILADERDRAELERAAPECPVVLLPDGPARGLLWIVWSGALAGVAFRVLWVGAPRWLYVPVYVAPVLRTPEPAAVPAT